MTAAILIFQVITRESLSTKICASCIQKLRVSYQFHNMCKKSTTILQSYLTELLSVSNDISADKFHNTDLVVRLSRRLPRTKRKRVGKDQRCSLLKRLLSKITQDQLVHNMYMNGMVKLCDKTGANREQNATFKSGGLKDLLAFTRDFHFERASGVIGNSIDLTPLEELTKFTDTFFYDHFGDYRDVILHIRDIDLEASEDEGMFDECPDEMNTPVKVKEEMEFIHHGVKVRTH